MTTLEDLLAGFAPTGVYVWRGDPGRDLPAQIGDAGWQVLPLDTSVILSVEGFYDALAADWQLPDWFGRNLDALWDVLAERSSGPTVLVWTGVEQLVAVDPDLAVVVLGLFRDAATQAAAFAVVVRPAEPEAVLLSELDALL